DGDDSAPLARESNGVAQAAGTTHALEGDIRATQQQRAVDAVETARAGRETDPLVNVARVDHLVGSEVLRKIALGWRLGDRDEPLRLREQLDRGNRQQSDRARAQDDDDVVLGGRTPERGVDAARKWFDEHRSFVGEGLRDRMQLARVRDQHLTPPSSGVGAVARLEPNLDRALGHVVTKARPALGTARAGRIDAAHLASERGRDDDTAAVGERGSGIGRRQLPGAIRQRSTRHPRCPATCERRASGLTATGLPTSSSMGRSESESAYAKLSASTNELREAYSSSRTPRASPAGGGDSRSPVKR